MQTKLNVHHGWEGADERLLDIYWPEGGCRDLFVYFHGGGLEAGDKTHIADMAARMTEAGIALVSANYRMYPRACFPQYIDDAAMAVRWAAEQGRELTGAQRLFVGGSSAGGYLAMMLLCDRRYLDGQGLGALAIDGYVLDAGQPTTHFNVLRERGMDTRLVRVDEAAPVYHIDGRMAEAARYPRLLFFCADQDMVNRLEQNRLMIRTLTHFGYPQECITFVLMENATHCSYSCGEDFCRRVADWIRE